MQWSCPCSCVDLASMLRQACGAGQKVDLAAQEGALWGQQEACQELLGCQEACQEACQACQESCWAACEEACQEALSSDLAEGGPAGGLEQQFWQARSHESMSLCSDRGLSELTAPRGT